jgi:ATP-dependent protease ClpP protease subunit
MAVRMRRLQAQQRQQRFNRARQKQQRARLSFSLQRQLLKDRWLRLRRRINRWLQSEAFAQNKQLQGDQLQQEIYVVKDRVLRERETRVSER